ncbi:uncharacterized protein [Nicotiana tomentosiformis]|uniref:uncharacterized protein n=1 Tax=Nicotiana tomentosiformis TaxID=4098 RepID=UPI00388CA635
MDGQFERTIQILEDMLHACVIDFEGAWDQFLPFAEFAYNNNYQSGIQMALYEALYGRQCRSTVGWFDIGKARLLDTDFVRDALEKVKMIQDRFRMTQSRQKSYVDQRARDVAFMVGERVLLIVLPIMGVMRFKNKGKLSPHYISPFEILERVDFSLVQLNKDLTYDEESVAILDMQVRKLRSKNIASVKVQWRGQTFEEEAWKIEHDMRSRYP